jgi:hypothetical protein
VSSEVANRLAADALLALHFAFVAFVVLSLPLILAGGRLGWSWVRNRGFRFAHLAAIGVVVLQAWLGRVCPLTAWEMSLRARAGDATYSGAFVAHWLERALYYDAPAWVFVAVYSAFGCLVVLAWYLVRPGQPRRGRAG